MSPRIKRIQVGVFFAALAVLVIAWALVGFRDTWLFAVMIPVIIPNPWWVMLINKLSKKKDQ